MLFVHSLLCRTSVSWLYPPGLTGTRLPQNKIPVSIPQTPSPVACVQLNKQQDRDHITFGLGDDWDWTYYNSAPKVSPFEKHSSVPFDRPLILTNLPPKPINIALEDEMARFYNEVNSYDIYFC